MTHGHHLFPDFEQNAFRLPVWFARAGLSKYKPLVSMLRASWAQWAQADKDGLTHLAPFIVLFNAPPAKIRKEVGGHVWHRIRTANVTTNANRMVLRLVGGWTLEEAMEWPVHERRGALKLVKFNHKSELLTAFRHTAPGERVLDNLILARDFTRMGGMIDPTWGKGRLKREHDALAMKRALDSSDPTPWAKPWFCDIDGYTFTLLTSETELAMEGISQRHCCRSYARSCRNGVETVFSILGPERATMSWNSRYQELQVKAFANRAVKTATRWAAHRAISKYLLELVDRKNNRGERE